MWEGVDFVDGKEPGVSVGGGSEAETSRQWAQSVLFLSHPFIRHRRSLPVRSPLPRSIHGARKGSREQGREDAPKSIFWKRAPALLPLLKAETVLWRQRKGYKSMWGAQPWRWGEVGIVARRAGGAPDSPPPVPHRALSRGPGRWEETERR